MCNKCQNQKQKQKKKSKSKKLKVLPLGIDLPHKIPSIHHIIMFNSIEPCTLL